MPLNKYEEKRLKNIKGNVEKMESLGVGPTKLLLDKLSNRKKNAYHIVPSKKTNTEESESDYEPLDDGQTESEESDSNLEEEETPVVLNISSRTKVESFLLVIL